MIDRLKLLPLLFILTSCAIRPVTEPRRPDPANEPTPVPTAEAIEKPTYTVETGTVDSQFIISGRIAPVQQTPILFPLGGQLVELAVQQGDQVAAGDVLARLDTADLEQQLSSAQANLDLANAQLAAVEANLANARQRAEIGYDRVKLRLDYAIEQAGETPSAEEALQISLLGLELDLAQLTLDELETAVDPALAVEITRAELVVSEIQATIDASTLIAPSAGEMLSVNVRENDFVTAENLFGIIADLTDLEVNINMVLCDMRDLAEGMRATAVIANRPGDPFEMTVRQLPYPYGSGNQTEEEDCSVKVAFNDPAEAAQFQPGDRATLVITIDERENVLWLPPAAVREFNGRSFVVIQEGGAQKRIDVSIGLKNDDQFEIKSGVEAGQVVIGP